MGSLTGRQRYSHPPAQPPHNMEIAMEPNGGPWCATANQVTNTLTASPTQGPATLTGCAYRHDSFVQPVGLRNSDFFDEAENQKDQQGRSLVAPRQPRTLWLPKPGTSVSANAAVTNTQTSLKIVPARRPRNRSLKRDIWGATELRKISRIASLNGQRSETNWPKMYAPALGGSPLSAWFHKSHNCVSRDFARVTTDPVSVRSLPIA
jgi:hypothetical protein